MQKPKSSLPYYNCTAQATEKYLFSCLNFMLFETKTGVYIVKIPGDSRDMKLLRNIGLDNYKSQKEGEARKIFSVGYENLTTFIYYQDGKNVYKLVVAKEDNPPIVIEKDITRAQAFRLMNTRP